MKPRLHGPGQDQSLHLLAVLQVPRFGDVALDEAEHRVCAASLPIGA